MDVRIGVTYSPKEIDLDLDDGADKAALQKQVGAALGATGGVLWLTERKGRTVGIPADKIAYIELGSDKSEHRVGFVG